MTYYVRGEPSLKNHFGSLKRKNNYKNNETSEDKFGSFYHVIQKIRNRNKDYNELKKVEKIILYFRNKEFWNYSLYLYFQNNQHLWMF